MDSMIKVEDVSMKFNLGIEKNFFFAEVIFHQYV